ncbi:phosphatidylinositol mannoside acyltransferase [Acidiferrimicrobium sp. IK]|uniref:phosphatidylinositol mannoside acyltransferase n=1 Tax=Acidiferrimicrobium sp. IK TaxID=2871700 RepID=UPI0021CAE7AA|nr:phosphatidylinositol mannoside acyltransferase [Acidiferrimicrobium sp. IK]MCU4184873.1 phosphatidylinositol mannoside acyltransferase [Acidiferrimicrobium sp. IK]
MRAAIGSPQLAVFKAGSAVAAVLPGAVGRGIAEAAGVAAARLPGVASRLHALNRVPATSGLRQRRRQMARHLRRVEGPDLAGPALAKQLDAAFASYARYWAESLRLPSLTPAEVDAGMSYRGMQHLYDALALGRGAILALPHLGGWEWGGMWLAHTGTPVSVVVEAIDPPELFEWFTEFRRRLGMDVIANGPHAAAACLRALKEGRTLCLLSDRVVGDTLGVEVEFFGERTRMPAGPVTLGLRTGAPVLPAAVYFTDAGSGHLAVVRPPLPLARTAGRLRDDITAGTQLLARELEVLVRRDPTQWHLMHPNWPSDLA